MLIKCNGEQLNAPFVAKLSERNRGCFAAINSIRLRSIDYQHFGSFRRCRGARVVFSIFRGFEII